MSRHHVEVYDGEHPAIIDQETFDRVGTRSWRPIWRPITAYMGEHRRTRTATGMAAIPHRGNTYEHRRIRAKSIDAASQSAGHGFGNQLVVIIQRRNHGPQPVRGLASIKAICKMSGCKSFCSPFYGEAGASAEGEILSDFRGFSLTSGFCRGRFPALDESMTARARGSREIHAQTAVHSPLHR